MKMLPISENSIGKIVKIFRRKTLPIMSILKLFFYILFPYSAVYELLDAGFKESINNDNLKTEVNSQRHAYAVNNGQVIQRDELTLRQ